MSPCTPRLADTLPGEREKMIISLRKYPDGLLAHPTIESVVGRAAAGRVRTTPARPDDDQLDQEVFMPGGSKPTTLRKFLQTEQDNAAWKWRGQ